MDVRLLCIAVAASACGGSYGGQTTPKPAATGIEAAGLPYTIIDARTGRQLETATFWQTLGGERAVCVGEEHSNPHHHWVELEVAKHLFKTWPAGSSALGLEMVQRPFQGPLDDYAAKRIDAAALRSRVAWDDRWGYDYAFYGPTIDVAVEAHDAIVALNAAKELTKKVAHHGLEGLTPDEKKQLPQLELHDAAHRAWFDALMEDMGGSEAHAHAQAAAPAPAPEPAGSNAPVDPFHRAGDPPAEAPTMPSADQIYTVQVIWDETMADTAATWLAAHAAGHLVILAGNGHCHDSAIVNRIKRRGVAQAVSVRAVIDDGEGVAEALAKPMNDYLFVLQPTAAMKAEMAKEAAEQK